LRLTNTLAVQEEKDCRQVEEAAEQVQPAFSDQNADLTQLGSELLLHLVVSD